MKRCRRRQETIEMKNPGCVGGRRWWANSSTPHQRLFNETPPVLRAVGERPGAPSPNGALHQQTTFAHTKLMGSWKAMAGLKVTNHFQLKDSTT
jgi:hypothetical protein